MPKVSFRSLSLITAAALALLFLLSSSTRQVASEAAHAVRPTKLLDVPIWHFSVHKPPQQINSTSEDASWYSDWRWLNPFSSSVTLDEDRALLPPLPERPFIYTYYDTTITKDKEAQKIDKETLLTWRRAWWAKGFRPVVLTQAEASTLR